MVISTLARHRARLHFGSIFVVSTWLKPIQRLPMRLLQMDFQPMFMAGLSLRKVDKSHWAVVRSKVVSLSRPACSLCGFVAKTKRAIIHADEVWSFVKPPGVLLADVRPLCQDCHEAKDFGELLRRIARGDGSASRTIRVISHYCAVNDCSTDEFDEDFKAASLRCREIEKLYGWNLKGDVVVDYGLWDRPADTPRLGQREKELLKRLYVDRDEPIIVGNKSLGTFSVAVRYLQSLPLQDRTGVIAALTEAAREDLEDDEPLIELDEGVQLS